MYTLLLAACSGVKGTSPETSPTETLAETTPTDGTRTLSVQSGFGAGSYAAGDRVHVWADVDPQREIALGWGEDGALLEAPLEWNSALMMPDRDVSLSVEIETVEIAMETRAVPLAAGTRTIRIAAPSSGDLVGVVLFFHGASYNTEQLTDNAAMGTVTHLVRAGLLVVAVPSEAASASGTGGWDAQLDLQSNADLQNAAALLDVLRADQTISAGLPVIAWGMSSGGYFAHTVGAAGLASLVVAHCAPGNAEALATTSAKTAWYLAEADVVVPTAIDLAEGFRDALTDRGIDAELYVHPQTPLYSERFTRITGVDLAVSAAIADALRSSGAVDSAGLWQVAGSAASVEVPGVDGDLLVAVEAEIEMMAADHELYDDAAARMVAFLQRNLPAGQ